VAGKEAALNIGAPIPPIVLIHTKVIGKPGYEPIDGWHGAKAAENAGLKKIPAYVGEGDPDWTTAIIAVDDTIPTPPSGPGKAARCAQIGPLSSCERSRRTRRRADRSSSAWSASSPTP
jgi:ParB-like chromosome segregation protein Spo0J